MLGWIISFICLLLGCKLLEQGVEKKFGIDIHRRHVFTTDNEYNPMSTRALQLAQLGLIFGTESFFSIVIGLMYGPLAMAWFVIGTTFFGAGMAYYGGMYAVVNGQTINTFLLNKWGKRVYLTLRWALVAFMCVCICSNFIFLTDLNSSAFGSSQWMLMLLIIVVFCLLSPRGFIRMGITTAAFLIITTLYFVICSIDKMKVIPMDFSPWSYQELKFAYPLMFFTISAGAVSGIQALKSSLIAPYLKNEKVGKAIFWRSTFWQTGIILLWNLLIISWNPTHDFIISIVYSGANLYNALSANMADNIFFGKYLLYLTMLVIGLTSIISLMRVSIDVILETRNFPPATLYMAEGALLICSVILYPITVNYNFSSMMSLVIPIYVLFLTYAFMKSKGVKLKRYLLMAFFLSGIIIAEFALRIYHYSLKYSVISGVVASFLVFGVIYYKDALGFLSRLLYWRKKQIVIQRKKDMEA